MQETYWGQWKIKRLTPQQIKEMKENMKKVPEIQKKAEEYHEVETKIAEKILNKHLEEPQFQKQVHKNTEKSTIRNKIKKRRHSHFAKSN